MDSSDPTAPDDHRLRDLIADCLARAEAEGPEAIDAVCAAHPAHAARIRAALQQLGASGLLAMPAAGDGPPRQVGEYRLLQRLGQGGMGVVFLAEQPRLGRRVALKLMRADLAWVEGSKDRLRREVEAVARLDHPAIVKVFDVGEHGGQPFYSMELVTGLTLGEVIARFHDRDPGSLRGADLRAALRTSSSDATAADDGLFAGSWAQTAIRIVQRVAGALAHAHARGIVHRDVKPSNVMLTAAGRVVLLDFGLAQLPGAAKITRTGSVLGSLAYMSPEQISRLPVDARTDVYSLGVTLYELLTLRSAFAEDDHTGIEWRILHGMAPAPRRVCRSVPADADTVCTKAMERQTADRYQTMAEVVEDLGNVLELRPVRARPPTLLNRGVRLARRHVALTTALAAAAVLGIGVPALWWWQEHRAQQRIVDVKLDEAAQFLAAMDARIKDERLANLPGSSAVQQQMIRDVLEHFERTRALQPDNQELCRTGVRLLRDYGSLFQRLSAQQDAVRAYERCIELAERIVEPTAEDDRILAAAWCGRLTAVQTMSRDDEAGEVARLALEFHDAADRRQPGSRFIAIGRASIHMILSRLADVAGDKSERDAHLARAIEQVQPLAADDADDEAISQLAWLRAERGNYARSDEDFETARTELAAAVATHSRVVARQPQEENYAGRLAQAVMMYSVLLQRIGREAEAERLLADACARIEAAVQRHPEHYIYRSTLGGLLHNLAQIRMRQDRAGEALDLLERAIGQQTAYLERNPDNRYARVFLANHRVVHAFALVKSGRHRGLEPALAEFATLKGQVFGNVLAADVCGQRIRACAADHTLEPDQRAALAADYGQQALTHVRAAVDAGLDDPAMLAIESLAAVDDQATLAELREVVAGRRGAAEKRGQ